MKKFLFLLLLIVLLALGFSQTQTLSWQELLRSYHSATALLEKAEKLADQAQENEDLWEVVDQYDAKALAAFSQILPSAEKAGYDSLAFFIKLRTAYISLNLNDQATAKSDYLEAINLKQHLPAIPDSFLFLPFLYTGIAYYSENLFDSATHYYTLAEKVKDSYKNPLKESQRLYNLFGTMYYETGNYRQARNYYEKAIAVLKTGGNMNKALLANYQINIASLLIKLEEYVEAKAIFEIVLHSSIYNNEVYHNLAIINLKEGKYKEALRFLKNVNYSNSKKNIELLYNMAMCWSGLGNTDSANLYLTKAIQENEKWYGKNKSISYGLILKYKAEQAGKLQAYEPALHLYQQALIQFCNNFSETDSTKNPDEFSGVFSYINLFNTLVAKADVLEKLYGKEKKINRLENSLAAYKSAFKLADYVEKTYNTDEARLFLGRIKYTVHSRPIDISLHLYQLTKDKQYLEAAWNFDQKNKASLLSINLHEINWKNKLANGNKLLQEEISLKESITRSLLKAQNNTDSTELAKLNEIIRDKEIELSMIQDKLNQSSEWKSINKIKVVPGISVLQKELDGSSAIVSYHLSETKILIFCLTGTSLNYEYIELKPDLVSNITIFRNALQNTTPGEPYKGKLAAKYLFKQLIAPIIHHLSGMKTVIVIPDDELHYLPFDALQDGNDQFLLQHFSIQYLFSASLFQKNNKHINYSGILGFAPFASDGNIDSNGIELKKLVYSKEEIERTKGEFFIDSAATKKKFMSLSNKYSVLHLATHAAVNNDDPNRSYIAFYPDNSDYLLYAPEIYNLDLDSTQLVVLSACETGTGRLVKGEGLMSLSRAFSYAGCSNIIATLWKAEDKTTSFITQQLYFYLNKGFSKAKALQKAKIDLLENKEISPSLKSPNYWSHLVFIGDYEPNTKSNYPIWLIMAVCLGIAGIIFALQYKK